MIEIKNETEKVILVGVSLSDQDDTKESLEELKDLVSTAGAETVGMVIQNREQQHPGTYVGKGKIEELKSMIWELRATGIVCDDELSPAQMKNLQDELDVKVMDRTLIILDIFAARASTSEGKIQVELAQLKYQQTRLAGFGKAMSRLGGGIGTRGPGEKKLEMDRRLIKSRIAQLNRELKDVKKHREVTREQRSRSHIPVAAIVGYTNAGKSTLLNLIGGIEHIDGGHILVGDTDLSKLSRKELALYRRNTLGFIFQFYHLVPNLTVKENIESGAYLSKNPISVEELMETLGLTEHQNKYPNQLSGGQQQRVSIGRAMINNPALMLADEPTGNLDKENSQTIMNLFERLNKQGMTIVMVTHDTSLAKYGTRVVRVEDGRIIEKGKEILK